MARVGVAWWPGRPDGEERAVGLAGPQPVDGVEARPGGQAGDVPRRLAGHGVGVEPAPAAVAEPLEGVEVVAVVDPGQLVDGGGAGRDHDQVVADRRTRSTPRSTAAMRSGRSGWPGDGVVLARSADRCRAAWPSTQCAAGTGAPSGDVPLPRAWRSPSTRIARRR